MIKEFLFVIFLVGVAVGCFLAGVILIVIQHVESNEELTEKDKDGFKEIFKRER